MEDNAKCIYCGEPAYKGLRVGPVCRSHCVQVLERHLGIHAPKFKSYQEARGTYTPAPLFQEMEMKP